MKLPVLIFPMHHEDVDAVVKIHAQQFPRQKDSNKWISCNFAAFPRIMIYVARDESDKVIGYVQWCHKSGFRKEAVLDLEQIAVEKSNQGMGVGTKLIKESLESVKDYLSDTGSKLKAVMVSTRTDNDAQRLYQKALGAEPVAVIKDLYSSDEVIMLACNL